MSDTVQQFAVCVYCLFVSVLSVFQVDDVLLKELASGPLVSLPVRLRRQLQRGDGPNCQDATGKTPLHRLLLSAENAQVSNALIECKTKHRHSCTLRVLNVHCVHTATQQQSLT